MYLYLYAFRYVCLHALHIHETACCMYECLASLDAGHSTALYATVICQLLYVYFRSHVHLMYRICSIGLVYHPHARAFVCMYVRSMLMILNKVRRKITYL